MECVRCGPDRYLVYHHEKYKEIHGYDKIVILCRSCHNILHSQLRKNKKCNVSVNDLQKISQAAKKRRKGYQIKKHAAEKLVSFRYQFNGTVDNNIRLRTSISYNINTQNIGVHSRFEGSRHRGIIYLDEV